MRDVELLMPAGNLEKLEYAVRYGANAVYLGVVDFSLRAMRKGSLITMENLKQAVDLAHSLGAKAYVTINIFAFNNDIKQLETCLDKFKDANPDAFIVSDYGIFNMIRKNIPNIPIHVSTQTNTLNYESVKFWRDLGASRVILARELAIDDIAEIRRQVPDIELECFVHGAQCVSFSGRCLLSDYFSKGERKANHGNCSQPCRWSYKLVEETRPNEYLEINQDGRGSHILSPKDLCLVKQLPQLIDAGVDSFKVEGRTKSLYYVSAVAKTYRQAIDEVLENPFADMEKYFLELQKVGNRGYTTGFALGDNNGESYSYDISKGLAGADFLCEFQGAAKQLGSEAAKSSHTPSPDGEGWDGVISSNNSETPQTYQSDTVLSPNRPIALSPNYFLVKIKNKMHVNNEVEIITPKEQFRAVVESIKNEDGDELEVGNTNDDVYIKFSKAPEDYRYAIARTVGIKNPAVV